MSDIEKDKDLTSEAHSNYMPTDAKDEANRHHLSGMYQHWFLDYASYVILERAVPHLADGLKPVQRRILHTMKRSDDGRYSKVAGIVGDTMHFHPHGDQSICGALVQLGQKDLLIDTQGNWGNILTGDGAAAPRYIEARLSKLALDILFNPKTTEWKLSYDGRNKEPVALPVKFPLLLAQGAEGIAVGLSAKILPHNFGEICQAAIKYLHEEDFDIYPDFLTGGSIDATNYNDGLRGGSVKVRANISKLDQKTLVITEIPYGTTTSSLIDSILRANEKGKIKIKKVEDNTAAEVEIIVQLTPGTSSDKTIDALYAFTDCEVSISPNCVVIEDNKPLFLSVKEVLKRNVDATKYLLQRELEIRRNELSESLFFASLERIFIEERMYKHRHFEQAQNNEAILTFLEQQFEPFKDLFFRPITQEDYLRLLEIKMARITRFNKDKADELIARIKADIARIDEDLQNMVAVTCNWFQLLYDKYADQHPRHTELKSFDTIVATKVAEANEKLYINRADGFMGTNLKKDEFVDNCSDLDDVIIFYRDGTYKVTRVAEKVFIGETERSKKEKKKAEIIHIAIFKKKDKRTIYNVVYRDGKTTCYYIKRFNVTSITHDREYDVTQGKLGSKISYFSANPNGEAEQIKITLKPNPKVRKILFDKDFSDILVKGRASQGNILSKYDIHHIALKAHGASTLGGRKVWFDHDVKRLNFDEHGQYLGEFHGEDKILVVLKNGEFYTTNFDASNHYEGDILLVEKFSASKVWTAAVLDADQNGFLYIKRFTCEATKSDRHLSFIGDNTKSELLLLSGEKYPRFEVELGGNEAYRPPIQIEVEEFIGVKSYKAKGKRVTTFPIDKVKELEPTRFEEEETESNAEETITEDNHQPKQDLFATE